MFPKKKVNRCHKLQIRNLIKYMASHKEFASGETENFTQEECDDEWKKIRIILNKYGPERSVIQWQNTWRDLKKRALYERLNVQRTQNELGGTDKCVVALSETSKAVLEVLGKETNENYGDAEIKKNEMAGSKSDQSSTKVLHIKTTRKIFQVRSTQKQIRTLINFMASHKEIAVGNKSHSHCMVEHYMNQWEQLRTTLAKHGPAKSLEQWRHTWQDLKKRARDELMLKTQKAQNECDGSGDVITTLSESSATILEILGLVNIERTNDGDGDMGNIGIAIDVKNPQLRFLVPRAWNKHRDVTDDTRGFTDPIVFRLNETVGDDAQQHCDADSIYKDECSSPQQVAASPQVDHYTHKVFHCNDNDPKRKIMRSTRQQMRMLIKFMASHKALAIAAVPENPKMRQDFHNKWKKLRTILAKYGPDKSVSQWRHAWRDLKKRARDAMAQNAQNESGASVVNTFSETTAAVLEILYTSNVDRANEDNNDEDKKKHKIAVNLKDPGERFLVKSRSPKNIITKTANPTTQCGTSLTYDGIDGVTTDVTSDADVSQHSNAKTNLIHMDKSSSTQQVIVSPQVDQPIHKAAHSNDNYAKRKITRSTSYQISTMINFMAANKDIAYGGAPQSPMLKQRYFDKWEKLRAKLAKHGPDKSVEQWRTAWRDQKRRAREAVSPNAQNENDNSNNVVASLSKTNAAVLEIIGSLNIDLEQDSDKEMETIEIVTNSKNPKQMSLVVREESRSPEFNLWTTTNPTTPRNANLTNNDVLNVTSDIAADVIHELTDDRNDVTDDKSGLTDAVIFPLNDIVDDAAQQHFDANFIDMEEPESPGGVEASPHGFTSTATHLHDNDPLSSGNQLTNVLLDSNIHMDEFSSHQEVAASPQVDKSTPKSAHFDDNDSKRKAIRSTVKQIRKMIKFMAANKDLGVDAAPLTPTLRQRYLDKWKKLRANLAKYGPDKSVVQWRYTWRDLKKRARKEMLSAQETDEVVATLSESSATILKIIGLIRTDKTNKNNTDGETENVKIIDSNFICKVESSSDQEVAASPQVDESTPKSGQINDNDAKRKAIRSTGQQIRKLIVFMAANEDLAVDGAPQDPTLRQRYLDKWEKLRAQLAKYGPDKSVVQWRHTWRDLKNRARKEMLSAQEAQNQSGSTDEVVATLSESSATILKIIGLIENNTDCETENVDTADSNSSNCIDMEEPESPRGVGASPQGSTSTDTHLHVDDLTPTGNQITDLLLRLSQTYHESVRHTMLEARLARRERLRQGRNMLWNL